MKKIISVIVLVLFGLMAYSQEKSCWLLLNRQTGEYAGDASRLSTDPCSDVFLWQIEASDGPMVHIVNVASGNPLCGVDASLDIAGYDYASRASAGWYTIDCGGQFLASRGGKLVFAVADRNSDYSAQWSFVRKDSENVPYVIGPDFVRESSFLGERSARAVSATEILSDYHGERRWKLSSDISSFPQFSAKANTIVPALYNLALEETLLDIRKEDNTFMAGALWPQTWTRDAIYSIYFAYSWILPEISRKTLEKQTLKNPGEALQDTGSGGSYPISTDRVVWALAAWEYYLTTGDKNWLRQAYESLSYTARKDIHVAYDRNVHLFRGETCSMDWRIHTYPNWFTNANIGESFSSGTNALHFFLYKFLSEAGRELGVPAEDNALWGQMCEELREGINKCFWDEEKGVYSCYLYPEFLGYRPSSRTGVMSNGLAALLGVASDEQVKTMLDNYPIYAYGGSVLYPTKPDSYAYHNKSVWPVWQTPVMYAAKKQGNYAVCEHLVRTAIRAGALFLTHKENMTYDTGYDRNTALNSDRQLWSVASYLSIVYRILFGIELCGQGMSFSPMMPEWMGGEMSLTGLKYRKATVNLSVSGCGTEIASIKVNGKARKAGWVLPANARGKYDIRIVMKENTADKGVINLVPAGPGNCWSPEEPVIRYADGTIFWTSDKGYTYRLYGRDVQMDNVHSPLDISKLPAGYYCICAVDSKGVESDLSNPVLKSGYERTYSVDITDLRETHKDFDVIFSAPSDGDYVIWFTGKNGHGPHDVYCTIRSLSLDGVDIATLILEAFGDWDESTNTNHIILKGLEAGEHTLTVRLNPEGQGYDNNMSLGRDNLNDWIVGALTIAKLN